MADILAELIQAVAKASPARPSPADPHVVMTTGPQVGDPHAEWVAEAG